MNNAHWQCKENLHYTKLMWIFQTLDLHQLTQNFWKQYAPNFISCEFAANTNFTGSRRLGNPHKGNRAVRGWMGQGNFKKKDRRSWLSPHSGKWNNKKTNWTQLKNLMNQKVKHFKKPTQVWWLSTHEAVEAIYSAWTLLILSLEHEAASSSKDGAAKARGMI